MLPPPAPAPAAASSPPSAYSVPPYLMNSSPGTVMTTLMSEADLDFEEMHMRGARTPQSPSPLRRSPRKRPHGTHSGVNPYATARAETPPPPAPRAPSTPRHAGASPGVLTRSAARRLAASRDLGAPPSDDEPPSPSAARAARQESARTPLRELFGSWTHSALERRPSRAGADAASPSSVPSDASLDDIEVFEDPYGILAASGFGEHAAGLGVSADTFRRIEVHQAPEFAQQYAAFTAGGGLGIAAHTQAPAGVAGAPVGVSSAPPAASLPAATAAGAAPAGATPAAPDAGLAILDDPSVQAMLANLDAVPAL